LVASLGLATCSSPAPGDLDGRLVFGRKVDGNADIYAMAANGGGLTRLTDSPGWDGEPAWSPDGSQIVFASDRAGGPAIYVMNADGGGLRALTDPAYASLTPAWSPDGQRIAFASTRPDSLPEAGAGDRFAIWTMASDGGDLRRVAADSQGQLVYPTWGPKSDRLAYVRQTGATSELLTQLLEENAAPRALKLPAEGRPSAPAWSPSGKTIAFSLEHQGAVELWQVRPDGSSPLQLGLAGANGGEPAWSPDGQRVVYVANQGGATTLMIMDAAGKNVRGVAADGADYAHPDWHE
jgi:Tol biopolymer transport system component